MTRSHFRIALLLLVSVLAFSCKKDESSSYLTYSLVKSTFLIPAGGADQPAQSQEDIFEYDSQNRVIKRYSTEENRLQGKPFATYAYNSDNQLIQSSYAGTWNAVRYYQYDATKKCVKSLLDKANTYHYDPTEDTLTFSYDTEGNRTKVDIQDHEGNKRLYYAFKYENGNLIEKIMGDAADPSNNTNKLKYEYYLNKENKLKSFEEQLSVYWNFATPSKNLLKKIIYSDGSATEYSYEFNEQGYPTKVISNTDNEITVTINVYQAQ